MSAALPESSELNPASRALLCASAGTDVVLRTALASVVSAVRLPTLGRSEREHLAFYADLADAGDPSAVFATPPEVEIQTTSRRGPDVPGVNVEVLSFTSPYVALHPGVRGSYARHEPNRTAYAQHTGATTTGHARPSA